MRLDFGAEWRRAVMRIGLIGALIAAWSAYALGVPASSGTAALRAALSKKSPSSPASTSVSWAGGGVPLASQEMILRARAIAEKVNGRGRDLGMDPGDRRAGDDDPHIVVPMLIDRLGSPSRDDRAYAAMTFCDNRFASWEGSGAAVAGLEAVVAGNDPEGAEFAALALKRIRFWTEKRRGDGAPR